jgi:hypothetical protein
VSGRIRPAGGVRKAVRSWCPLWTPDGTARASDGGEGCGGSGIEHGVRVVMMGGSWCWSRLGLAEGGHNPLPLCPVRARTCRPRGWPWPAGLAQGRTLGALEVSAAWPSPSGRGPDHRLGGHLELGMSGDRTVERSAMSVARPATVGCPQEELIGGYGVQVGVGRPPSRTVGMSGRGWRGSRGATGRWGLCSAAGRPRRG